MLHLNGIRGTSWNTENLGNGIWSFHSNGKGYGFSILQVLAPCGMGSIDHGLRLLTTQHYVQPNLKHQFYERHKVK